MSEHHVQNQSVQQRPEVRETPEVRRDRPERAPSAVARTMHSADASRRVSYKLEHYEHDFQTVSTSDGEVKIINSSRTDADNDRELDRGDAVSIATHAQYRRFIENGGQNRGAEAPTYTPEAPTDTDSADLQNDLKLLSLRSRGRV